MLMKFTVLSLWYWEDSEDLQKMQVVRLTLRSLLKQRTLRTESGIEQQEGTSSEKYFVVSFLAFEINRGRWKFICALVDTSDV